LNAGDKGFTHCHRDNSAGYNAVPD
jgi:hypothetical protein